MGMGIGMGMGLGSDRESAALFVLASWRVLCVCCNQTTNDHKKSSALRLPCVVIVVSTLMPQAACLHFKARSADPAILGLTKQLVSLVLVFGLLLDSIRFISIRFVVSLALFYFVTPRFVFLLFSCPQIVASSC